MFLQHRDPARRVTLDHHRFVVGFGVAIGRAGGQDAEDDAQHLVGGGDGGALEAAPDGERLVIAAELAVVKELADTDRGAVGKVAVAGMRECGGKVKATVVERTDAATLVGMVEESVVPGTTVYTDEAAACGGLKRCFNHDSVKHGISEYVRGDVHTNGMESVWSVLDRSIHGTWHHVSPKHLGRYVNEATFRLNEGNCEVDTIERMEAFAGRIGGKRLPYAKLVRKNGLSSMVVPV